MAELGHDMEVDVAPAVPYHTSKLRETITASLTHLLDPIRQVVREEVRSVFNYEQRMQKPPAPDPAIGIHNLHEQLQLSDARTKSLSEQVERLEKEAALAQLAVSERDKKNKKLQQVIIENSQNLAPPMDEEIVTLFTRLNHDVMRIVKKYFSKPMRGSSGSESAPWKEYKPLSPENRELWVRALIADDLYEEFFPKKRRIFGLNAKREEVMNEFELSLTESGKVSEADIVDWRIRTISCGQKLGLASPDRLFHNPAYEIVRVLRPVGPPGLGEQKEAEKAMAAIYSAAFDIAILFRKNTVPYSWLQKKSPSSIPQAEVEIIGSTHPSLPTEQCRPWRIVFGGVVKSQDSEEDRVVLNKSELLVN